MDVKKRKIVATTLDPSFEPVKPKVAIQILELHPKTKEWLVEWRDKTRTWEVYDTVKDQPVFRLMVEKKLYQKNSQPTYIA